MSPMHMAIYDATHDSAGAFTAYAPVADPMLFVQGNNIRVPTDMPNIMFAAGGADGVVLPRWRLTSPSLIAKGRPEVTPLNVQNAVDPVPDSPPAIMWMLENPLHLAADELLFAELNNNPAATQFQWLAVQFCDKAPSPIVGADIQKHRATGTTTLTANAWTNVTLTLDDNLQPGTYAVVGMRPLSAGCIAARIVFNNDPGHRPGALGSATNTSKTDKMFRDGRLGEWGRFPFTQFPTVDFFSQAADTAETVELDLVKVG